MKNICNKKVRMNYVYGFSTDHEDPEQKKHYVIFLEHTGDNESFMAHYDEIRNSVEIHSNNPVFVVMTWDHIKLPKYGTLEFLMRDLSKGFDDPEDEVTTDLEVYGAHVEFYYWDGVELCDSIDSEELASA